MKRQYKGYEIEIVNDEEAEEPSKASDMLGMVGQNFTPLLPRYIGDRFWIKLRSSMVHVENAKGYVCYAPWDKILAEYNTDKPTPELEARVKTVLQAELQEYMAWTRGEVHGYVIRDCDGHEVDSCPGYYEPEEAVMRYAEAYIDTLAHETAEALLET